MPRGERQKLNVKQVVIRPATTVRTTNTERCGIASATRGNA